LNNRRPSIIALYVVTAWRERTSMKGVIFKLKFDLRESWLQYAGRIFKTNKELVN